MWTGKGSVQRLTEKETVKETNEASELAGNQGTVVSWQQISRQVVNCVRCRRRTPPIGFGDKEAMNNPGKGAISDKVGRHGLEGVEWMDRLL